MDKSRKLRRYRRKDYTQLVEFPVEIIGRDGVVRRYSFEESVRLYQRRIASADVRYNESEVVLAERAHCKLRIEQLRRSYFAHFGWPSVEVVDGPTEEQGRMSGEVAAFLRRCLTDLYPDLHRFVISLLDTRKDHQVFFVVPPPTEDAELDAPLGHFLLYIYRFAEPSADAGRDAFFRFIKVLDGLHSAGGNDLELLIAFHHTSDCGLIITGSQEMQEVQVGEIEEDDLELSWVDEEVRAPDRLEEALVLVRRGLFEEALDRFVAAYGEQHYQRVAYLGAAVIGDLLGRDQEAATAAIMGTRYFPRDPALQYHHALNLLRAGEHSEARAALEVCGDWPSGQAAVQLLEGLIELDTGKLKAGESRIQAILPDAFRGDSHLRQGRKWFLAQLAARRILRLIGVLVLGLSLPYAIAGLWIGALPSAVVGGLMSLAATMLFIGGHRAWRRQLGRHLRGPGGQRMNLTSTSVLHRGGVGDRTQ
jgi:hypothetical protein